MKYTKQYNTNTENSSQSSNSLIINIMFFVKGKNKKVYTI